MNIDPSELNAKYGLISSGDDELGMARMSDVLRDKLALFASLNLRFAVDRLGILKRGWPDRVARNRVALESSLVEGRSAQLLSDSIFQTRSMKCGPVLHRCSVRV